MKAAICHAFGEPLRIEDVVLAPPGAFEISVDVKACAICHSDISYIDGFWAGQLPAVYGHEASGVVAQVGEGVTSLKPGDRVIATLIRSCGECHYCAQNSPVLCEEVFALDSSDPITNAQGKPYHQAMRSGAFAEKITIHESQVVPIPDDVSYDVAALLGCGVLTGYGAVMNTAKVKRGQSVAIVGCGGVGLNVVQACAIAGASPIIAIDTQASKRDAGHQFGATHSFSPTDENLIEAISRATQTHMLDYVFVATGAPAAFDNIFRLIDKNGAIVIVGMPPSGVMASYDPGTMAAYSQKLMGSKMGDSVIARDIPLLIEHYRAGRLQLDNLITGRFALKDINEAIAQVKNGEALRNIIVFDEE